MHVTLLLNKKFSIEKVDNINAPKQKIDKKDFHEAHFKLTAQNKVFGHDIRHLQKTSLQSVWDW